MIERVPAESIEPITAFSAPTVRPLVSSTDAQRPAIMTTVSADATGADIAVASASRNTGRIDRLEAPPPEKGLASAAAD